MATKQVGVRLTDEEFAVLTRRAEAISKEAPELEGRVTEGKIAGYAIREYIVKLQEEEALSTGVQTAD